MSTKKNELKFEEAFHKLEKIVAKLEEGKASLDESLKLFEEGTKLSRFCSGKLEEARKKVEILLRTEQGEVLKKPFAIEEGVPGEASLEENDAEELEEKAGKEEGEEELF